MKLRHGDIEIELPEGWADASQIVAVAPALKGSAFRPTLVAVASPMAAKETLNAFAARHLKSLQRLQGFKLESDQTTKLGPHTGWERVYQLTLNGSCYRQLQFLTGVGGGLLLTYSDLAAPFEESVTEGRALIAAMSVGGASRAGW